MSFRKNPHYRKTYFGTRTRSGGVEVIVCDGRTQGVWPLRRLYPPGVPAKIDWGARATHDSAQALAFSLGFDSSPGGMAPFMACGMMGRVLVAGLGDSWSISEHELRFLFAACVRYLTRKGRAGTRAHNKGAC